MGIDIKRIDLNENGILDNNEARNLTQIMKDPQQKAEIVLELNENQEFKNATLSVFENNIKQMWDNLSDEDISILMWYAVLFKNENLKYEEPVSEDTMTILKDIVKSFNNIWDKNESNETISLTVDEVNVVDGQLSFINPQTGEEIQIDIDNLQVIEDGLENIEQINKKKGQLTLANETGLMYRDYLQSIANDIKWRFFDVNDEKHQRYMKQIQVINKEVDRIDKALKRNNSQNIQTLDLEEAVDNIFVSEEGVSQWWVANEPLLLWDKWIFVNPLDSIDYTNNSYESIKRIILRWNNEEDSFDNDSIREKTIRIFEKIRANDGFDDDRYIYNSGDAIQTRLQDDILEDTRLKEKTDIKTCFEFIENLQSNLDKQNELVKSVKWWKEWVKQFLESNWLLAEFQDKKNIVETIYKEWKIDEEELKKALDKQTEKNIEKWLISFDNEQEKIDYINKNKENIILKSTTKSFSRLTIQIVLNQNQKFVSNLWQQDKLINLYSQIEWIWDNTSDSRYNERIGFSKTMATQIAIMYISGLAQLGTRMMIWWNVLPNLTTAGKLWTLMNIWREWILLIPEWMAFYGVYEALNGLIEEKSLKEIWKKYNIKDFARTTMFLGVLRALPLTGSYDSINKIKLWDKFPNQLIQQPLKLTLDTVSLLGTDIVVRLTFDEWVPDPVENWWDFFNFVQEELKFIVPLVIWLRWAEWSVWWARSMEWFGENLWKGLNGELEIKVDKSWKIIIKGLQVNIKQLEQRVNIVKQKRKTPRNIREKKQIRAELNEKKKKLKWMKGEIVIPEEVKKEKPKGVKPKVEDGMKENSNYTVERYEDLPLRLDNIKLEDVLKWFHLKIVWWKESE